VEQDLTLIAQARRHEALARRARLRAKLDIAAVGLLTAGAAWLADGTHDALMSASLVLSLGILFYVIRRDRDLTRLAGVSRWREEALEGRGLTLEDWRSGAELEPWEARRRAPADPAD
jgi:hypothetical protein